MGARGRKLAYAAAGALLVSLHAFWAVRWAGGQRASAPWDPAVHLDTAADYRDALKARSLGGLLLTKTKPGHPPYPPLYHLSLIPLLGTERPDAAVALLNLLWLALLGGGAAWVALRAGGGGAGALAAGAAVTLSPSLVRLHREAFPDPAMAGLVAAAYAVGLASEGFSKRRWAWAAGALAGLALLAKWSAFVYLAPLFLGAWVWAGPRRALECAAAAALLCFPWYAVNLPAVLPRVWNSMNLGAGEGDPVLWTLGNWTWYPLFTARLYGWPLTVLMGGGALWSLACIKAASPDARRARLAAAGWLLFSYVAWSLVSNKDARYFIPVVAALPALAFSALPTPAALLGVALAAWGAKDLPRPDGAAWPLVEILQEARRRAPAPGAPVSVCVMSNHVHLNTTSLRWVARHAGLTDVGLGCQEGDIPEFADFALLKTVDPGPFLSEVTLRHLADAAKGTGPFSAVFEEKTRWDLPDGSHAVLYAPRERLPFLTKARTWPSLRVKSATLEGVRIAPAGPGAYELSVATMTLDKLAAPVRGLRARLEGARIIELSGRPAILRLDRLDLQKGALTWAELSAALTKRAKAPVLVGTAGGALTARIGEGFLSASVRIAVTASGSKVGLRTGVLRLERALTRRAPWQPFDITLADLVLADVGPRLGAP